jgi:hypothetical protein
MYNRAIAQVGAAKAAGFLYLMPAFGAVQSIALLGEELHWYHVAGLAAIFAGIVLSSLTRKRQPGSSAASCPPQTDAVLTTDFYGWCKTASGTKVHVCWQCPYLLDLLQYLPTLILFVVEVPLAFVPLQYWLSSAR